MRLSAKKSFLFYVCVLQPCSVFLDVYSVTSLFLFYLTTCVCVCHSFHVYCGSAFEPGASRLPYYCTSISVRSWCNWRASCVDSKPKTKTPLTRTPPAGSLVGPQEELRYPSAYTPREVTSRPGRRATRRSKDFQVLHHQTNKQTNKRAPRLCDYSNAHDPLISPVIMWGIHHPTEWHPPHHHPLVHWLKWDFATQ